jgi:hypothetical protein
MTSESRKKPVDMDALHEHVEECEECGTDSVDVAALSNVLRANEVALDANLLSRATLARLQPELARRAALVFRRRLATGLIAALIPLPAVLLFDAFVLRALFGLVSLLIPTTLAAYVVLSYAVFLLLMTASVYGAIPLLVERQVAARAAMTS